MAEAAPNAAIGVLKLYRAYREQSLRLKDLSALFIRSGPYGGIVGRTPANGRGARHLRKPASLFR